MHGPLISGRRTYLVAFIDDYSRALVGYRWGAAEDVLRLEAALRAGVASRGVPEAILVDYADLMVMPTFLKRPWKPGVEGPNLSA